MNIGMGEEEWIIKYQKFRLFSFISTLLSSTGLRLVPQQERQCYSRGISNSVATYTYTQINIYLFTVQGCLFIFLSIGKWIISRVDKGREHDGHTFVTQHGSCHKKTFMHGALSPSNVSVRRAAFRASMRDSKHLTRNIFKLNLLTTQFWREFGSSTHCTRKRAIKTYTESTQKRIPIIIIFITGIFCMFNSFINYLFNCFTFLHWKTNTGI